MKTIDTAAVEAAVARVNDLGESEVSVRASYSGRAMYGATCFALVADRHAGVTSVLLRIAQRDPDLAQELVDAMRTDDMGLGMVAYFPGYALEASS